MTIRAGQLMDKITIQWRSPLSPSKNEIGEDDYVWADLRSCRARIRSFGARGLEHLAAKAQESKFDIEVQIRFFAGITPAMRIYHDGDYYDIAWINNVDMADVELLIYCAKGASRG
jgi:SPP1 family predicted phage head-tail adaptor